jgi:hypothetical protein
VEEARSVTPDQYDEFLSDLRGLREACGLPSGALDISPREAFLKCIKRAREMYGMLVWAESGLRHGGRYEWLESLADQCLAVRMGETVNAE